MGDDAADLVLGCMDENQTVIDLDSGAGGWTRAMAVGELDAHAHLLIGLALQQLAQDHHDGDVAMFSALFRAWLNWASELHCPACERHLIDLAQDDLAVAAARYLH